VTPRRTGTPRPAGTSRPTGTAPPTGTAEGVEERRGVLPLLLLSVAVLLAMAPWFAAAASASWLAERHTLSPAGLGWLTGSVQLGFVLGTLVVAALNLADLIPARVLFGLSALLAAGANGMALWANETTMLMASRGMTGFFLAGVYPPAMKMAATWFKTGRGVAIGAVVGALTLGKALPFLLLDGGGMAGVGGMAGLAEMDGVAIRWTSMAGVFGGGLVLALWRVGPYPFPRRAFALGRVIEVVRHRPTRQVILGYAGHMWELYAMWALIAVFFRAHFLEQGATAMVALARAGLSSFVVIAAGAVGSLIAGVWADRIGRARVATGAMVVSGTCALTLGWLVAAPTGLVLALALVWGISVVADSAQFSAMVTEVAPPHAVGTALTLQTSFGFLLTAASIAVAVEVVDRFGWGPAFTLLALGPLLGIAAMRSRHK